MAKIYCRKDGKVYWSDDGIYGAAEDAFFELSEFLAGKTLDGHDECDQWYMLVCGKLDELLMALDDCPFDSQDDEFLAIKE